ncbi:hypothetical protein PFNF135_01945 [Plasmodium falciparum NF135/5.C10]|uniref:Uncharacterized protein n=1 Tax=Plasmodium falciparum NF135/5.C10 TaxID=1036726 RepID=W4IKQ5_PLAFA|nr:hypothetical protein PFNF135_01945 [Plasmodium falciparum NF135/5.C10]
MVPSKEDIFEKKWEEKKTFEDKNKMNRKTINFIENNNKNNLNIEEKKKNVIVNRRASYSASIRNNIKTKKKWNEEDVSKYEKDMNFKTQRNLKNRSSVQTTMKKYDEKNVCALKNVTVENKELNENENENENDNIYQNVTNDNIYKNVTNDNIYQNVTNDKENNNLNNINNKYCVEDITLYEVQKEKSKKDVHHNKEDDNTDKREIYNKMDHDQYVITPYEKKNIQQNEKEKNVLLYNTNCEEQKDQNHNYDHTFKHRRKTLVDTNHEYLNKAEYKEYMHNKENYSEKGGRFVDNDDKFNENEEENEMHNEINHLEEENKYNVFYGQI